MTISSHLKEGKSFFFDKAEGKTTEEETDKLRLLKLKSSSERYGENVTQETQNWRKYLIYLTETQNT